MQIWAADQSVFNLVEEVKNKHHLPRLAEASIAVSIADSKAFIHDRFNWGKTSKFSSAAKVWHPENKRYDFLITIPADAWNILSEYQKEAYIDLRITCMQIEYEPEMVEENGKKKPVKDEHGRKIYTDVPKLDDDGNPKFKVIGMDLGVFQENVSRYGCWIDDISDLKSVFQTSKKSEIKVEEIESSLIEENQLLK